MAEIVAIVGPSGTGKSTSIQSLDPATTVLIGVDPKGLPFRGWKKKYTPLKGTDFKNGNYVQSDNSSTISKVLKRISDERPEIKTIVVDDCQYIMANEFMARALETGFTKFTEIGLHGWQPLKDAKGLRDNLIIFFLYHDEMVTDSDYVARRKIKTIGKLVDEKITLEGMFRVVLFTQIKRDPKDPTKAEYLFITQSDGKTSAKSPAGMFDYEIPNSLDLVRAKIETYDNE